MLINLEYEILNSSDNFVDFLGIEKSDKKNGLKITLENDMNITVSNDHIFIASGVNMFANSLVPNVSYLTTEDGDFYVKSIEKVENIDLYDIVDSVGCEYFANGFLNHNCSFLGSGDNFISEEHLRRIEEHEIRTPIRQEYSDLNMWIFEDAEPDSEYIMGVDVSPGHGDDNSTINILKYVSIIEEKLITKNGKQKKYRIRKNKVVQVAEYYGKLTPQALGDVVYHYCKRYNNAFTIIDVTGGYGTQTVDRLFELGLEEELVYYSEVTHKPTRARLAGYIKKGKKTTPDGATYDIDLIPGFYIGNNRGSILLEMQRAINMEDITIRSFRLLNELKTFVTVGGSRVADHKRTFHDDSIISLALSLFVLNFDMGNSAISKETTKKMLDALVSINNKDRLEIKDEKEERIIERRKNRLMSSNARNELNPYLAHDWLFKGLDKKRNY